jgi:hypothetical protein
MKKRRKMYWTGIILLIAALFYGLLFLLIADLPFRYCAAALLPFLAILAALILIANSATIKPVLEENKQYWLERFLHPQTVLGTLTDDDGKTEYRLEIFDVGDFDAAPTGLDAGQSYRVKKNAFGDLVLVKDREKELTAFEENKEKIQEELSKNMTGSLETYY